MGSINASIEVSSLDKKKLLTRAKQFIFSTGLNDGTSKLCKANMKYGLAQFHIIQEKYGLEPNATFISSPDETISRNAYRWNSGLGYGGRITWGKGNDKLVFLNTKPNQEVWKDYLKFMISSRELMRLNLKYYIMTILKLIGIMASQITLLTALKQKIYQL